MPKKLDDCVKAVMKQGKTEGEAFAICNAQFNDSATLQGHFNDSAKWNSDQKTAISVRDGVLEYLGAEIGLEPADKVFTVYRSPATIANTAGMMSGIPLTDEHVDLDSDVSDSRGSVVDAMMIDLMDESTDSKLAIQNKVNLQDSILEVLTSGKRELSLGYKADLVPHDRYDFEQKNIQPHHLAVVSAGRCGSACSFIDRKPTTKEGKNMPKQNKPDNSGLPKAFHDADGKLSLEQIVDLAQKLPEAIKKLPTDELDDVMPALEKIVAFAAESGVDMPEEEKTEVEVENQDGDYEDEEKEKVAMEDSAAFKDAVQKATDAAVARHAEVMEKAVDFVDEGYTFKGKSTEQIMRDALATQHGKQQFSDNELSIAFKMLKPQPSNLRNFGDTSPSANRFDNLKDKEL